MLTDFQRALLQIEESDPGSILVELDELREEIEEMMRAAIRLGVQEIAERAKVAVARVNLLMDSVAGKR